MRAYVLRRLLAVVPLLLAISALTFTLVHLRPVDPTAASAESAQVSAHDVKLARHALGLDRPAWVQYLDYLRGIATRFDFGESAYYRRPVAGILLERLGNTLLLTVAGALVTWLLAVPLGVVAAVRAGRWLDRLLSVGAVTLLAVPEVLSGLLLLLLAARTHWFPIGDLHSLDADTLPPAARALDVARHLVLPAIVVGLVPLASRMRQMRAQMLDVLGLDFVTTARAKGLPERVVVGRHALRNALNPMITLFGLTLGSLVSGSFVAETIFNWPGLARVTMQAIQAQDQVLVLGAVMMSAAVLVLGNLVADLLLVVADPRIGHD